MSFVSNLLRTLQLPNSVISQCQPSSSRRQPVLSGLHSNPVIRDLLGLNPDEDSAHVYPDPLPEPVLERFLQRWTVLNSIGHPLEDLYWVRIGLDVEWPYFVCFGGLSEASSK